MKTKRSVLNDRSQRSYNTFLFQMKGITNEDRIRLYHNLINCRRVLVDGDLLRRPQDLGGGFLRNTLRRYVTSLIEPILTL